ncbi:MAG: hypothetical protein PHS86_05225 [Syntrophaceae bacterium]|nr:hypothetical protein [Syntrophaceae bacterium]
MLVKDSGHFVKGLLLLISFLVVLAIMFMPYFGESPRTNQPRNAMEAADDLFNAISKGSTLYIPDLEKKNKAFEGTQIEINLKLKSNDLAQKATKLLTSTGAKVSGEGVQLKAEGDLSKIIAGALADSNELFFNRSEQLQAKYGFSGREVIFTWWNILKDADRDLKRQNKFKEATFIGDVTKRAVEVAFNFYGIEPQSVISKAGILTFALVFYVIYTLWWGIAIFFLFEGFGLEMTAGSKKEV